MTDKDKALDEALAGIESFLNCDYAKQKTPVTETPVKYGVRSCGHKGYYRLGDRIYRK